MTLHNPQKNPMGLNRAEPHATQRVLLKESFDERLISRYGPINWSTRIGSCDLTPLDNFLGLCKVTCLRG